MNVNTIEITRISADSPTWDRAGVYYVRTEGMVKSFGLPMSGEFATDTVDSEYILAADGGFPVGTCRLHPLDEGRMKIERVCVLPDYRGKGVGRIVIRAAENWAKERGFSRMVIAARDEVIEFYEAIGYIANRSETESDEYFSCTYTYKSI
ncbi:MAG: GNAT family N-acetyltransferase [Clostridiales Family XIII bacterium]|jgi:GNAT superfamily N-acetyltransferase|nr:GNAT family N-acetyltransferase [Clostridiales Family XIII bacterium]